MYVCETNELISRQKPLFFRSFFTFPLTSKFAASDKMKAKGVMGNWDVDKLTIEEIEKSTNEMIKKYGDAYDAIGQIETSAVTFENTILPMMELGTKNNLSC